jgi:cytochrome oxidase Cu insertion factor (SCO1/SenC/PrrC family)
MSSNPEPAPTNPAKPTARSGRMQALLILLVCAAPIVGGTFAFMVWDSGRTTNYGELITPRKVELVGEGIDGKQAALSKYEGKWRFVIFDGGHCDEQCQRKLLYTRQIRLAQGREQTRIERIWLIDDASMPNPEYAGLFAEAHLIRLPAGLVPADFEKQGSPRQYIYLVDPLGYLMMRYSADPEPAKMIKDLQRLLKYSRIG